MNEPLDGSDLLRRLEVIYGEGVRALERQGRRLDELRARTGVVLTAGSISASLLGAVSLREKGSLGAWAWSGVGAFAVLGLLAAWLLAPSTDWTFSLEPKWMLRRYVDGDVVEAHLLSSLYRETAEYADEYYVKNEAKLRWRTRGLSLGCVLLVVELVTLLIDLGTRR